MFIPLNILVPRTHKRRGGRRKKPAHGSGLTGTAPGIGLRLVGRVFVRKVSAFANPVDALYLSPIATANYLGAYSPRLAAEADLWQEFRFTRLKIISTPAAVDLTSSHITGASSSPIAVGFSNIQTNAAPTTLQQVLDLPVSDMFMTDTLTNGAAPDATRTFVRASMTVGARDLRPAFTPWLKTVASTAGLDVTLQGAIYVFWNYVAFTSLAVDYLVEYEIEFRNPVPASATIVLRKDSDIGAFVQKAIDDFKSEEDDVVSVRSSPKTRTAPGKR